MKAIEELVLDEERFNYLLKENYGGFTAETGEECKVMTLHYLDSIVDVEKSLENRDIVFIKQLSKISHHINKSSTELDDKLELLYELNLFGIKKTKGPNPEISQYRLKKIEAHLLSYAGEIAKTQFKKTQKLHFGERWYEHKKESGDISVEIDTLYSAREYSQASQAALSIFKKIERNPDIDKKTKLKWLKKAYNTKRSCAIMTKELDPHYSIKSHSYLGEILEFMALITKQKKYALKAIKDYKIFLDYFRMTDDVEIKKLVNSKARANYNLCSKFGINIFN